MRFREIKDRSRRLLHDFMGQPALYYANPVSGEYVVTKARPHSKRGQIGDLPGTNLNYAEVIDRKEKVVLWREDVPKPTRLALIVFSATEGYWVDSVDPPDGLTISVNVVMAKESELQGLTLPDEV